MKRIAAILVLVWLAGCRGQSAETPSEPSDDSQGSQPVVEVLDDPELIEQSKALYEQELDQLYPQAIGLLRSGELVYTWHLYALRERKDQALADIKAILADSSAAPSTRVGAAEQLMTLEDPAGEAFLWESIRSVSSELGLEAMRAVYERYLFSDAINPEQVDQLASLLDHPDENVVRMGAGLCVALEVPDIEGKLVAILQGRRLSEPQPIASNLALVATTPGSVEALLPHLLEGQAKRYRIDSDLLSRLEESDDEVLEPIRQALCQYILQFEDQRYDQGLVGGLAQIAGRDAIPILEDIRKNASDPVSRGYAVQGLARLNPEQGVDLLLEHMEQEGASHMARTLSKYAGPSDFDRISSRLLSQQEKWIDLDMARLLIERLGPHGKALVEERLSRLTPQARMWTLWKLQGYDLPTVLQELKKADVINAPPQGLIEKAAASFTRSYPERSFDLTEPDGLIWALAQAGIMAHFDVEFDFIPPNHNHLILEIAQASRGRFKPQWPSQVWHQKNEEDYEAPYTVQFVYGGRLLRTRAENYGDWYDLEAVLRLINVALETAGQPERYIPLRSDGQIAQLVFADPAAFIPIAQKYGLPLSQDASEAMREGLDFERRVRQALEK